MKRFFKFQSAALALTVIMGFAVVALSQTSEKVADHESRNPEKVHENRAATSGSSAKVKIPVEFEASRTEQKETGSTAKSSKAASLLGVNQKSDTANLAQTQAYL